MKKYFGLISAFAVATIGGAFLYYNSYLIENRAKLGDEAFAVFGQYIDAAKMHDSERLKTLSYQVSPACSDPEKKSECIELMDSAVFFLERFKREDFTKVYADKKQIVLLTDYRSASELENERVDDLRYALFFVREAEPKVLGFRFCFRDTEDPAQKCFDTKTLKRDRNNNDWWDELEKLFR